MVNYSENETEAKLDNVFDALAHDKRRGMVYTLAFRPATVSQLATQFDLSLPAIHKHIRILEKARLIDRRKVGRINFVALDHRGLRVLQEWSGQFRTEWGSRRQTLENYIAGFHD